MSKYQHNKKAKAMADIAINNRGYVGNSTKRNWDRVLDAFIPFWANNNYKKKVDTEKADT